MILIDEFGASTYENDGQALLIACINHWNKSNNKHRHLKIPELRKNDITPTSSNSENDNWNLAGSSETAVSSYSETIPENNGPLHPPFIFISTHFLKLYEYLENKQHVRVLVS